MTSGPVVWVSAPPGQCRRCGVAQPASAFCRSCGASAVPPLPVMWPKRPVSGGRQFGNILLIFLAAVLISCVLFLLVAGAAERPSALFWAGLAAFAPAVVYGSLILLLDRADPEPRKLLLFAFGWGAVAAVVLALILEILFSAVFTAILGPNGGALLDFTVIAPVVEETTKGMALLILLHWVRGHLDNTLDGIIYGAFVGLGFSVTENIVYFTNAYIEGGAGSLGELFVVRSGVNGLGHVVYTAMTGAAVGWARGRYGRGGWRFVVPVLGWSGAVLAHSLWNTGALALGYLIEYEDFSFLRATLTVGPFLSGPPLVFMVAVALIARRREMETIRRHLGAEVALGVISPQEWVAASDRQRQRAAIEGAERRGGRDAGRRQRRIFQLAARLALFNAHIAKGERPSVERMLESGTWRWELASLRAELAIMR